MLIHYHSPIAHEAIVELIETLHDIEALIGLHILNSRNIMETVTLKHEVEQAHHTLEHKIFVEDQNVKALNSVFQ